MKNMTRKYRRIFAAILLIAVAAGCWTLTSCGRSSAETPRWIQLRMPDGNMVEGYGKLIGSVTSGLATVDVHGVWYRTHVSNIVICSEKP